MMRAWKWFSAALVVLAGLAMAGPEAVGQVVPYRTKGDGAVYVPATGLYTGTGTGTHLGRHTFEGTIDVQPTANPLVFMFFSAGPQTTTAANGDVLYLSLVNGLVQLVPLDSAFTTFTAVWTADVVVEGGTGRFAHAAPAVEPMRAVAVNDPFTFLDPEWTFDWTIDGQFQPR